MPAQAADPSVHAAPTPRARRGLSAKLLSACLAGAAVGAVVLTFGGQAAATAAVLWTDHVLPAFLDLHMSGLPFC